MIQFLLKKINLSKVIYFIFFFIGLQSSFIAQTKAQQQSQKELQNKKIS